MVYFQVKSSLNGSTCEERIFGILKVFQNRAYLMDCYIDKNLFALLYSLNLGWGIPSISVIL